MKDDPDDLPAPTRRKPPPSDECRCHRAKKAPGALFCRACLTEYAPLWTTPPAPESLPHL